MKCSRCGEEALVPASFCPSCGERLSEKSPSIPTLDFAPPPVNASDVVLMFADQFAEERDEGYKVPCSGKEVGVTSLVVVAVTAALVSLSEEGLISLSRGQKKGFLFKSEVVTVKRQGGNGSLKAGLEGRILGSLAGDPNKDSVRDIVRRVLGNSTIDPYTVVISQIMDHAHRLGFFVEDEKAPPIIKFLAGRTVATPLSPLCDHITTIAGEVPKVHGLLEAFKSSEPELFAMVGKDVKKSIESAYIQT